MERPRTITATLSRRYDLFMGQDAGFQEDITGPLSQRRSGFPSVIQHDCLLNPKPVRRTAGES